MVESSDTPRSPRSPIPERIAGNCVTDWDGDTYWRDPETGAWFEVWGDGMDPSLFSGAFARVDDQFVREAYALLVKAGAA